MTPYYYFFLLVVAVLVIVSAASQIHTVGVADISKDDHPSVYGYRGMNIGMCGVASLVVLYAIYMIYVTWKDGSLEASMVDAKDQMVDRSDRMATSLRERLRQLASERERAVMSSDEAMPPVPADDSFSFLSEEE